MADYLGTGILSQQSPYCDLQGGFLQQCAGIGGSAVKVDAAFIAHSDAVAVVTQTVGAYFAFRTHGLYLSVLADVIVIGPAGKPSHPVGGVDVLGREVTVYAGCTAMYDDETDLANFLFHAYIPPRFVHEVVPSAVNTDVNTVTIN